MGALFKGCFSTKDGMQGITFTELIVYIVIIGTTVLIFSQFFGTMMKGIKISEFQSQGLMNLRNLLMKIEWDLYEANELMWVSASSITFICDIVKNPNYNLYGDRDSDRIPNIQDPDDDNDAHLKFTSQFDQQWRVGYDLEDDDDDNDNRVDVRISFVYSGNSVDRLISINESPWRSERLAINISSFTLRYLGSKREDLGRLIDLGRDGEVGTGDADENDGIITEREIDWVRPPRGHGNQSGRIDTLTERRYIATVSIAVETDINNDRRVDARLTAEIMPPLLHLKARRR